MKNGSERWRSDGGGDGSDGAATEASLTTIDDPVEGLEPLPELPGIRARVPDRRRHPRAGAPDQRRRRRAAGRRLRPGGPARRRPARRAAQAAPALDRPRASRAATRTSARCTTPAAARSPRRCASSRCARASTPEFVRDEVARGRAIIPANRKHPESRADDHRPQLPGEDQRQHRQLGGRRRRSARRSTSCAGRSAGAPTR